MVAATLVVRPFTTGRICCLRTRFKLGETKRLRFEFNAENLFNQKTAEYIYNYLQPVPNCGSLLNLRNVNLFNGYDWQSPLNGTAASGIPVPPDVLKAIGAKDPRFGKEDNFRDGFVGPFRCEVHLLTTTQQ